MLQGPYGNFTLPEFIGFAERLVKTAPKSTQANQIPHNNSQALDDGSPSFFKNVGTAKTRTVSSSTGSAKKQSTFSKKHANSYKPLVNPSLSNLERTKRSAEPAELTKNQTDSSRRPVDLSTYSKPSRLDIVLPEFIIDHVNENSPHKEENGNKGNASTSSEVASEVVKAEENRAEEHDKLQIYVKKAVDAMKNLEESYKFLYDQITQAKRLFAENDPTRQALDDILADAAKPKDIVEDGVTFDEASTMSTTTTP